MTKHRLATVFFISILMLLALLSLFAALGVWYFVAVLVTWVFTALISSSLIYLNYHVKAYCNNPSGTQKNIAITFDDGPNETTLLVLDVLKKYDVKAAFFCIGKNIEQYPEILERIIEEGHLVGNHSYSHSHFFDFYRKDKVIQELAQTDALIEKITGKKVNFFRPPYGVTTPSIRRALEVSKHKVIGWNIRSMDGLVKSENMILSRVLKRVAPGSVVLLHDTSLHSVNILEQLLLFLRENNYKVFSLESLFDIEAYEN